MAFFKFRKGGDDSQSAHGQPASVDSLRRRARHRLIGAAVLVLLGVVGFPLLFDTQPRPVAVDIPIEIPDRNKVKPLGPPAGPVAFGPVTPPEAAGTEEKTAALRSLPAPAAIETEAKSDPKPELKAEPRVAVRPDPKPDPKAGSRGDGEAKAKALLGGKTIEVANTPAAVEGRFVVQVGAFADSSKARDARAKVEKAGLKTYTHVAETREGKRIRVRVGPFATRADADKAADRIKELDLPVAILAL